MNEIDDFDLLLDESINKPKDSPNNTVKETAKIAPSTKKTINSIPIDIAVEVSRKKILISELQSLSVGSVFMFDRKEGEPLDIIVNDTKIGTGQIVEENGVIGVKVLSINNE